MVNVSTVSCFLVWRESFKSQSSEIQMHSSEANQRVRNLRFREKSSLDEGEGGICRLHAIVSRQIVGDKQDSITLFGPLTSSFQLSNEEYTHKTGRGGRWKRGTRWTIRTSVYLTCQNLDRLQNKAIYWWWKFFVSLCGCENPSTAHIGDWPA